MQIPLYASENERCLRQGEAESYRRSPDQFSLCHRLCLNGLHPLERLEDKVCFTISVGSRCIGVCSRNTQNNVQTWGGGGAAEIRATHPQPSQDRTAGGLCSGRQLCSVPSSVQQPQNLQRKQDFNKHCTHKKPDIFSFGGQLCRNSNFHCRKLPRLHVEEISKRRYKTILACREQQKDDDHHDCVRRTSWVPNVQTLEKKHSANETSTTIQN